MSALRRCGAVFVAGTLAGALARRRHNFEPMSMSRALCLEPPVRNGASDPASARLSHHKADAVAEAAASVGEWVDGLPEFTASQVAQRRSTATRIWVIYRHGVYDITEFAHLHPGGEEALRYAAGRDISPFWVALPFHRQPRVLAMLENYRIGNINYLNDHLTLGQAAVREALTAMDGAEGGGGAGPGGWLARGFASLREAVFPPDMAEIRRRAAIKEGLRRLDREAAAAAEHERNTRILAEARREQGGEGAPAPSRAPLKAQERTLTESERLWADWKRRMHTDGGNMLTREKADEAQQNSEGGGGRP